MKYVLTGSIGHITKPMAERLISAGHDVSIITSSNNNVAKIEALGAQALVGSVNDGDFVNSALANADGVYLMIPPNMGATNFFEAQQKVADNYVDAVLKNEIKNVVQLSSIGAHLRTGAGPIDGLAYLEEKLEAIEGINVKMLRPSYFFYNLFSMIPLIKHANIMGSNFNMKDEKFVLTHTNDIADVAADALLNLNFSGKSIEYISSDERTSTEITSVLGNAINKPGIPWVEFKDEDSLQGMLAAGLAPSISGAYVQMGKSIREGKLQEDYWKNKPSKMGKIKLEDFALEFKAAFEA
jgi:uncharacterized protein YbjT (DUF2867 family)